MMQTSPKSSETTPTDLFIIGGGINGCGIARDAAGRGFSVTLAEMSDLASATSSASTKLFHGGLRYLEYFEFRLVRESLIEREVLLRAMPHISWPMRFVLPISSDMRFDSDTPTSRLLAKIFPWLKGRRPTWLIRFGLFLYDTMGGRKILPATRVVDLKIEPEGAPLQKRFAKAFEYSDCWVEDSRLVMLNARDAQNRGAEVLTRTQVVSAERENGLWKIEIERATDGKRETRTAKVLINAAGPWAGDVIRGVLRSNSQENVRLVRGSHIVTRKLYEHEKCYFFQGEDGRIIFAIPYEGEFTLIGTTDQAHTDADQRPTCTPEEQEYLLNFASKYFEKPLSDADVVWTYSGVRPLYDDGASSATAATREYVLQLDETVGAPVLNIFGGKITTYRKLAEAVLTKLHKHLPGDPWTAGVPLPGGDFAVSDVDRLICDLERDYPFLSTPWARRLFRAYGTETAEILKGASTVEDLGRDFGATITTRELDWAIQKEWVQTGEDFLWRRTKLGLRVTPEQVKEIDTYIRENANLG